MFLPGVSCAIAAFEENKELKLLLSAIVYNPLMRYPTGFSRYILWGCILLSCVGLALRYDGYGLAMDWFVISAALVWHIVATKPIKREESDGRPRHR